MASSTDYYKILDVSRTATLDEIRRAYKKLARKHHPDVNPDDPTALEKFKDVQEAWNVLGNEEKRKNYDRYGSPEGQRFQGSRPGTGGGQTWAWSSSDGGEIPFDIEELFGGVRSAGAAAGPFDRGRRGDWPIRGSDIRAEIEIPFTLAAEGGKHDLRFQRESSLKTETLSVNIPAGIDTGSVIRLAGQGTPGANGGTAGDLLVSINVASHPYFQRQGPTILLDVPISITEAALGTKVDIPTLSDGPVTLTIPPGTSSGTRLRLREKGILDRRTKRRGDMFAVVKIVAPKKRDDRSQGLLEKLHATLPQDARVGLWN